MKSKKQVRKYRTSITTKCKIWCNFKIPINHTNYCCKGKTYVLISVTTTTFPNTTATRTATKHMLTHHHTVQSHCRAYPILNIDTSMELAHKHASDVDITFAASQHKSSLSTLPTYNYYNNTSDHHTHPIHCHALQHHLRTTTTSTAANKSDPNRHI